jgi:hypothetical protein
MFVKLSNHYSNSVIYLNHDQYFHHYVHIYVVRKAPWKLNIIEVNFLIQVPEQRSRPTLLYNNKVLASWGDRWIWNTGKNDVLHCLIQHKSPTYYCAINLRFHVKKEAYNGLCDSMPNIIQKLATTQSYDRNSIIFTRSLACAHTHTHIYIYISPTGILSNNKFTQYSC